MGTTESTPVPSPAASTHPLTPPAPPAAPLYLSRGVYLPPKPRLVLVRVKIGLGALAINSYLFFFSFFVFNFLATVPTPFVASARASGDEVGAARWVHIMFLFEVLLVLRGRGGGARGVSFASVS